MKTRGTDASVRMCEKLVLESLRRVRGRPMKYWVEVIRQNMMLLQLTEDIAWIERGGGQKLR